MAFETGDSNNGRNGNGGNAQSREAWEAVGFLNVYLPANDGTRVKLGAIALKKAKPREKELAEWLEQDPDGIRIAKLLDKIELEYGSAEPSEGRGFDLT